MRLVIMTLALFASACSHGRAAERVELELKDTPVLEALRSVAGGSHLNVFADSDLESLEPITARLDAASGEDALAQLASLRQLRLEKLNVRGMQSVSYWVSRQTSAPAPVTDFTGEKITANFDELPIRDAARAISEVARTEIVVDEGIEANITLHLRLPWDLALYHLGQKYELRIVRTDGQLRITRR